MPAKKKTMGKTAAAKKPAAKKAAAKKPAASKAAKGHTTTKTAHAKRIKERLHKTIRPAPHAVSENEMAGGTAAVLALGLLPLALGHTLYNAGLRRVPATVANVLATQEVTGGILLSWLLLGIAPAGNEILGALITLGGIVLVLL